MALSPQHHPAAPPRFHKPSSVSPYKSSLPKPTCHKLFPNSPPHYPPPPTGDETGAMERQEGEPCVTPIASQFSPQENLALKVPVSQETPPIAPPKSLALRCSSPHLPACFPKGQVDLRGNHLPATILAERGDPGASSRLSTSLKSSLKTLTLLHMVFTSSTNKQPRV